MSLKKNVKERIKQYILEKIGLQDHEVAKKTADNFEISLTSVYRYIKELSDEGIIKKQDGKYVLQESMTVKKYYTRDVLEEDRVFDDVVKDYVRDLPGNLYKVWQYAFTEMMNNAIEHSNATEIEVIIAKNFLHTKIIIDDNGIGIFKKIKEYYDYSSLDDAVTELFKGKLTTDSENHTGEGIYFTSRMIEYFGVLSDGKIFTHNPHLDQVKDVHNIPQLQKLKNRTGTLVVMIMSNNSKVSLREVFDMFSNVDEGFIKTQIPLIKIFGDGFPVSRSQAKRLSARFEEFKEIVLDFQGIDDVGQGFAHELFVLFKKKNPNVNIEIINANDNIKNMLNHVRRS